jgi:YHS domain-containing protein
MNAIARFVRYVVWVLVLSSILRLLGKFAAWAMRRTMDPGQQARNRPASSVRNAQRAARAAGGRQVEARRLVRDPVCGLHLAETLAIPFRDGGELLHFCSVECRDKYANGILRRAANG